MPNERKPTTWSQKKIEKLIQLYAKEECLWNPYNENYKNKKKRNKAIEKICNEIEVHPQLFLKKVHNLRNQFNSEYKKLVRCLEESKDLELLGEAQLGLTKSKWVHFESLMFLKDAIVRIPAAPPPAKRIVLDSNNIDGEHEQLTEEYNVEIEDDFDEPKIEEEFQSFASPQHEEILNVKSSKKLGNMPTSSLQLKKDTQNLKKYPQTQHTTPPAIIELTAINPGVSLAPEKHLQASPSIQQFDLHPQDQWSAFGAFVANEMRNYNSDLSRRKLKRKIMQAMLEVAEDDELLN